ncbi:DHH family phosphoesterase [Psychromonas hadalis]|uniref:DHH family phosphoesterase n=1 Tax=Psychromonas hadalis TaxID=211669 RepID=UPI0003B3B590|nr:DHH family phosphoesterase [Psychromonas hadalis]
MDYSQFDAFLERLKGVERVIVQAHDFPSHDALASAFAFACLLKKKGFKPFISYRGYIKRVTLRNLIDWLNIPTITPEKLNLTPNDKIIVVGGCIGEPNVIDFPGLEVAVIDHHKVKAPGFVWYADIRPEYGATASMIVEYYNYCGIDISPKIATALLVGLTFGTDHFTKKVSVADAKALLQLQSQADMPMVKRIFRNKIELQELKYFDAMLTTMIKEKNSAFAVLPDDCSRTMLGVLGDFLLSVDEIDVAILSARHNGKTYISLRSECPKNDVNKLIVRVLNDTGIGFGGGLPHSAGGIIDDMYQLSDELDYVHDLIRPHLSLS